MRLHDSPWTVLRKPIWRCRTTASAVMRFSVLLGLVAILLPLGSKRIIHSRNQTQNYCAVSIVAARSLPSAPWRHNHTVKLKGWQTSVKAECVSCGWTQNGSSVCKPSVRHFTRWFKQWRLRATLPSCAVTTSHQMTNVNTQEGSKSFVNNCLKNKKVKPWGKNAATIISVLLLLQLCGCFFCLFF